MKANKLSASASKKIGLGLAVAGVAFTGYYSRRSYAGTCTPIGVGVYSCTGPVDGGDITVTLPSGPGLGGGTDLSITTAPGFGISTVAGDGIFIEGFDNGDIVFTDDHASAITGATNGLVVRNVGFAATGTTTVTVSGNITGTSGDGILMNAAVGVIGGSNGIAVDHNYYSFGSIAITTAPGTVVTGQGSDGIYARNYYTSSSIAINAQGDVNGNRNGIYARNYGTAGLSISVSGDVTGNGGSGIDAYNSANDVSGSLSIYQAAGTATGAVDGINADNYGGSVTINTSGSSVGLGGDGIFVLNNAGTTDLSVTVNNADGTDDGVDARNLGSGSTSITVTGTVVGGNDGIYASGGIATTGLSIDNQGSVSGQNAAIRTVNQGTGETTVTGAGALQSTAGDGLVTNGIGSVVVDIQGDIDAAGNGVFVTSDNADTKSITTSGVINAGQTGILITNPADTAIDVDVRGDVNGGEFGVYVEAGSAATSITTSGNVNGGSADGIAVNDNYSSVLTIDAQGNVSGGRHGIYLPGYYTANTGSISITGGGAVSGGSGDGINVNNTGTSLVIVTGNTVSGGDDGIDARNYGTAGLDISISGDVTGNGGSGIDAYNSANDVSGSLSIDQAAGTTTTGAADGITADNFGGSLTINALGSSVGLAGNGIFARNNAGSTDLTITANDADGAENGIFAYNGGSGDLSVTITGTVRGGSGYGLEAGVQTGTATINLNGGADVSAASGLAIVDVQGESTVNLNIGASVSGDSRLGAGNDAFNLSGGSNTGNIYGENDDDTFDWTAGTLSGGFFGGDGSDVATITAAAALGGSETLDGGDDTSDTDGWIDVLTIDGVSATVGDGNIVNWEVVNLTNSTLNIAGLAAPVVNTCSGSLTLGGTGAVDDVLGCTSDDDIAITGDTVVANGIQGAGGADSISILGHASVATVTGDGDGQDASGGLFGNDTITIDTTGTVASVSGNDGDDTIHLLGGSVNAIDAGAGGDSIRLDGAVVGDLLDAGDGDDTGIWSAGTMASFQGGTGSDTLELTAASYNGSQILDGGDDLSAADGWIDTLHFNGVTAAVAAGSLRNWENVVISGGNLSFVGNALTVGSDPSTGLSIASATILNIGGAFTLTGNLNNQGMLSLLNGAPGDSFHVSGNYQGSGQLLVDVDFGSATADTIVVAGDAGSGTTGIVINDVSSGFASGEDILLVDIGGNSAPDAFSLVGGSMSSGAFVYDLGRVNGDFLLVNSGFNPVVAVYEAYPQALLAASQVPTLERRVGNRFWQRGASADRYSLDDQDALWVRFSGSALRQRPKTSAADSRLDTDRGQLQLGVDTKPFEYRSGNLFLGITSQYLRSDSDVRSAIGNGAIKIQGHGFGVNATWYGNGGFYADFQSQRNWFDSDILSSERGRLSVDNDGIGVLYSLEMGKRVERGKWVLTPQLQVVRNRVKFDDILDPAGNRVAMADSDDLKARLGLGVSHYSSWEGESGATKARRLYLIVNVHHRFQGDTRIGINGTSLGYQPENWSGELGIGGSYSSNSGRLVLFGELTGGFGFSNSDDNNAVSGVLGIRFNF